MEQNNKFLGVEKISKLLLKFAVPCILSMVISALYNIVDQIFIGNSTVGDLGITATSVVFPITIITMAFSWAIGDGTAAFMSICQGRKDTKNSHLSVGNSLLINLLISLVFTLLCFVFMDQILYLFGASETSIGLCRDYFMIVLAFVPAFMTGNVLGSVVRADGSPAYSMAMTLTGAISNIILDALFIFGFGWGIQGAAWATIIGQVLTLILGLIYLFRTKTFHLSLSSFRLKTEVFTNVIKLGVSTFITQMAIVITSMIANLGLASWGAKEAIGADIPIATMGVCVKILTVIINITVGIIVGAQPVLGFNIGAGKNDRVREAFKLTIVSVLIVCIVATLLIEIFPGAFAGIFGLTEPAVYEFACFSFRTFLLAVTFTCLVKVISIFFQAVGEPLRASIISLSRDIVFFIPLLLILPNFMGVEGIFWAAPLADVLGIIVAVGFAIVFFRKLPRADSATPSAATIQSSHPGVIITISREHGSQGKKIGALVAKRLGVPYYYKELTALAAEESGITQQYIKKVNSNDGEEIMKELYLTTSPAKYAIEAQDAIIKEIAGHGSCVIVGRAADYVLRDHPQVLRVFIHAPLSYRIKNVMKMYQDTDKEAKKNIQKSDKNRADYYSLISGQDWGDARNYDLSISSAIGPERTADLIADFAKSIQD